MDKSSKDLMEQLKAWRYQYITRNEHPNKVGIHEKTDQNNCNSQGVYSLKVLVFETSSSVKQEFFSDFNQVRC